MPAGIMKGRQRTAPASPPYEILQRAVQKFEQEKRGWDPQGSPEGSSTAAATSSSAELTRRSIAECEEERGIISMHICWNDHSPSQDSQKVRWLFDMQRLFSIQLPKMPREYVTRLVFDKAHRNLVVHKKDKGVIAGICYRPFPDQGFAEIVFCAVTADEQVKGYGTHMMNHLKDYMVSHQRLFHLLTYADEFAIGYFAKQDFVTQIGLAEECYKGYIKDYQGATLMYCQLHPKMVYVKAKQIYAQMRYLYKLALREKYPNFGKEFDGLEPFFKSNEGRPLSAEQVPGMETLWNWEELRKDGLEPMPDAPQTMRSVWQKLKADRNAWPFLEPVNQDEVPDYYDFIAFPVDLGTIGEKLKSGYYTHERLFIADVRRMFDNCYKFNAADSQYYFHGYKLHILFARLCRTHFPHSKLQAPLPAQRPEYSPPSGKK